MTVAVQTPNDTGALEVPTGAFTVPLQIVAAGAARHRSAAAARRALPAWALLAIAVLASTSCGLAVVEWHGLVSVLLIGCALLGAGAAFALDLVGTLQHDERA